MICITSSIIFTRSFLHFHLYTYTSNSKLQLTRFCTLKFKLFTTTVTFWNTSTFTLSALDCLWNSHKLLLFGNISISRRKPFSVQLVKDRTRQWKNDISILSITLISNGTFYNVAICVALETAEKERQKHIDVEGYDGRHDEAFERIWPFIFISKCCSCFRKIRSIEFSHHKLLEWYINMDKLWKIELVIFWIVCQEIKETTSTILKDVDI